MFPAAVLPGTYYAATNNQIGYIDEAFDNVVCVQARCDVKRHHADRRRHDHRSRTSTFSCRAEAGSAAK